MPTFSDSYSVAGQSATFRALIQGYDEQIETGITADIPVLVASVGEWGTLASMRTLAFKAYVIPRSASGTTQVIVDVIAGPGLGSLNVTGLGSWNAILTRLRRTSVSAITGYVQGVATFYLGS